MNLGCLLAWLGSLFWKWAQQQSESKPSVVSSSNEGRKAYNGVKAHPAVTACGSFQLPLVPKLAVFISSGQQGVIMDHVCFVPQAFFFGGGRSFSSESEMLKQRTKYHFMIIAFVSSGDLLELCLECEELCCCFSFYGSA